MSTDTTKADSRPRISRVITRGRPFKPGNPGRPKGARHKSTVMLEALFAGEADGIARKAIALAKTGRFDAIKLVLDRACPPRKVRRIEGFALPPLTTVDDAAAAMAAIAAAVAAGTLAIEDARDMTDMVETFRKVRELGDIERRIVKLEKDVANEPSVGERP